MKGGVGQTAHGIQSVARVDPSLLDAEPTTWPLLTAAASLFGRPGSVPKSTMPPAWVQLKAWLARTS